MADIKPTLYFFRHQPKSETLPNLISSMQSLETSFFLIALRQYPQALLTCVSAIEQSIKGSKFPVTYGEKLEDILHRVRLFSDAFKRFPQEDLDKIRRSRNRVIHSGYSPKDDSLSAGLLIGTGLPFLAVCYRELHAFDLFDALSVECTNQLALARRVFEKARAARCRDVSYCLKGVGHQVRWALKENFTPAWVDGILANAMENGAEFEAVRKRKEQLERLLAPSWVLDCPLCEEVESAVCQLDKAKLRAGVVSVVQMACAHCGFHAAKNEAFLAEALMQDQLAKSKNQILKEYGLSQKT